MRLVLISLLVSVTFACDNHGAYDAYTSPGNSYPVSSFPFNSQVGVVCGGFRNFFTSTFYDDGYVSFAAYFPQNDIDIYLMDDTAVTVLASSESSTLNEALYYQVTGGNQYYFLVQEYGGDNTGLNYTAFIDFTYDIPCQAIAKTVDFINPDSFPTYTKYLCGIDYSVYTIGITSVPYNLTLDFEFNTAMKIRFALLDSSSNELLHTRDNYFSYVIETAGNYTLMVNQTGYWYGNYSIIGNAPTTTTTTTSTTSTTTSSTSDGSTTSTTSSSSTSSTSSTSSSTSSSSSSVTSSTTSTTGTLTTTTSTTGDGDNSTDTGSSTMLLTLEFSTDTGAASQLFVNVALFVLCLCIVA